MSYYVEQQNYQRVPTQSIIQSTQSLTNTGQPVSYMTYDQNTIHKRLNEINSEEQFIQRSLVGQQSPHVDQANIRLQQLMNERQELLRLMSQTGVSRQEVVTHTQPQYLVTQATNSYIPAQRTYSENVVRQEKVKSSNWINSQPSDKNIQIPRVNTGSFLAQGSVVQETVNRPVMYVMSPNQLHTSQLVSMDQNVINERQDGQLTTSQTYQPPFQSITTQQATPEEMQQFSEGLTNVLNDPQFVLDNYETYIDDRGNRHIRYVVKMGFIEDNPKFREPVVRNHPDIDVVTVDLKKGQDFQRKPIEHTTFDKNGNPVRIITTIDENGQPLQIINILQGDRELQYVSFLNEKGRQHVKPLKDFLAEHNPNSLTHTELAQRGYGSFKQTQQSIGEFQSWKQGDQQRLIANVGGVQGQVDDQTQFDKKPDLPTREQVNNLLRNSLHRTSEEETAQGLPTESEILGIIRNKATDSHFKEHHSARSKKNQGELMTEDDKAALVKKLSKSVHKVQKYLDMMGQIDPHLKEAIEKDNQEITNTLKQSQIALEMSNQYNVQGIQGQPQESQHVQYQPQVQYITTQQQSVPVQTRYQGDYEPQYTRYYESRSEPQVISQTQSQRQNPESAEIRYEGVHNPSRQNENHENYQTEYTIRQEDQDRNSRVYMSKNDGYDNVERQGYSNQFRDVTETLNQPQSFSQDNRSNVSMGGVSIKRRADNGGSENQYNEQERFNNAPSKQDTTNKRVIYAVNAKNYENSGQIRRNQEERENVPVDYGYERDQKPKQADFYVNSEGYRADDRDQRNQAEEYVNEDIRQQSRDAEELHDNQEAQINRPEYKY